MFHSAIRMCVCVPTLAISLVTGCGCSKDEKTPLPAEIVRSNSISAVMPIDGTVEEKVIALGKTDSRAMEYLHHLTEVFGPRVSGTPNLTHASEWAQEMFSEFGLQDVTLEYCAAVSSNPVLHFLGIGRREIHSVVGDIPGVEWKDEYVIVGAHIDSSAQSATGASDNGTGVAATMEAARLLMAAGAKPRRTIRFILFSGEEQGKLCSKAYVAEHSAILPKFSAMLNMDRGSDHISGITATSAIATDLDTVFSPVIALDPKKPFSIRKVEHLAGEINNCCGGKGSSDHGPFLEGGVPAFTWIQSGTTPVRYVGHSDEDTFRNVDENNQQHSSIVIAIGALGIANLDHQLDRKGLL